MSFSYITQLDGKSEKKFKLFSTFTICANSTTFCCIGQSAVALGAQTEQAPHYTFHIQRFILELLRIHGYQQSENYQDYYRTIYRCIAHDSLIIA
jgi:hypothetical protein